MAQWCTNRTIHGNCKYSLYSTCGDYKKLEEEIIVIEKYIHHGVEVSVQSELKGKHRAHCLCFQNCRFFFPDDPEKNCEIAKANFKNCVDYNLVLPVYECPKYALETNS
jgi:hypothetical protein